MFLRALSILSRYSRTFFERRLSDLHIGFTEHTILMYLNSNNRINQEQIAKHFMLDKGAVAKALNKLEDKEYITRNDNPNNRREKLISITEQGEGIINLLNAELQEWHEYLFKGLSKEEIEVFVQTAQKLAENAAVIINERKTDNEDSE